MSQSSRSFWEAHYSRTPHRAALRVSAVLPRFVQARVPGRALDIGCARGDDALWLATQGWEVTGADVAEPALEVARARASEQGLSARLTFEQHDLSETFPRGDFDLVIAMFLHSPMEFGRDHVLRRAARAVRQRGLLLIVAHGSRAPWSWAPPDTVYASAADELERLALEPQNWRQVFVGPIEREAVGPENQRAQVTDTVVALERR